MVAAQELGVPLEAVHISETKTDSVANTSSTAASASSDLNGMAVKNACEQLNERLKHYREKLGSKATMQELAHAAYFDRVNLSANGFYKTPVIGYTWNVDTDKQTPEFPGPMFYYFTQGVALAEVEIDTLTGDFTVLRSDIKMVCIPGLHRLICRISARLSMLLSIMDKLKELSYRGKDFSQQKKVSGFKTVKSSPAVPGLTKFHLHCIPTSSIYSNNRDIPQDFRVSFLKNVEWKNLQTIQRSRGGTFPPNTLPS
jgi:xanthine dehydrogenase/oxidase